MSVGRGTPCEKCGKAPLIRFGTNNGRLSEELLEGCEHERFRRRVCRFCPTSLAGKHYATIYCGPVCRALGRKAVLQRYEAKHGERVNERDRLAARRRHAILKDERNARARARYHKNKAKIAARRRAKHRWNNPSYQRKLASNAAWYARNREKRIAYAREYKARKRAEREQRLAA